MLKKGHARGRKKPRRRDPQGTRGRLLEAAFGELFQSGFQGTDLDSVVARAGLTKGALYHHFDDKESLGFAVVEEVIGEMTRSKWVLPLQRCEDPIETLVEIIQKSSLRPDDLRRGCPLNNLAQEMSPLDEEFRRKVAKVFADWQAAIAAALRRGQARGMVIKEADPEESATFLVALYEGYISLAKSAQQEAVLKSGIKQMTAYLERLRPA